MEAGKTVATFPHLWGITLCKDKLVVGAEKKMQFFTKDGSPLHIVDFPYVDSPAICYMHPGDVNHVYVSCHYFYAITDCGNILYKRRGPCNRRANGICIDRDGCVYVSSENSVVRLSKEGNILDQNVLDYCNVYDEIWALAFNRTYTQMYAATDSGNQLTVFDFR